MAAPNLAALCSNFGWLPLERVKQTIQNTTQFARMSLAYLFANITVLAGLLPTLTAGTKMSPPTLSFLTLLPMTMASWVIPVAPWLKFMPGNEAPNLWPMA
jgi:hypothetical protein